MRSIIDPPSPFAPASEWREFEAEMADLPPEDVRDFAYLFDSPTRDVARGDDE